MYLTCICLCSTSDFCLWSPLVLETPPLVWFSLNSSSLPGARPSLARVFNCWIVHLYLPVHEVNLGRSDIIHLILDSVNVVFALKILIRYHCMPKRKGSYFYLQISEVGGAAATRQARMSGAWRFAVIMKMSESQQTKFYNITAWISAWTGQEDRERHIPRNISQ